MSAHSLELSEIEIACGVTLEAVAVELPLGRFVRDGERLFKNARRAARAAIMRELVARERTTRETERDALRRMSAYLRLKVVANRERPSSGALASITWAERA